jgi:hypothetical protein|nr:MAG TPA: hypothetical protein [Caudoviricetes sp.]
MSAYATIDELTKLWRKMTAEEQSRAEELLDVVSDSLRYEAKKCEKDLDQMIESTPSLATVTKSVTIDIVARTLMTSTNREPMSQFSESAMGYTQSGTFLVPGGGLFIKDTELARLGIRRQRMGVIDLYGD